MYTVMAKAVITAHEKGYRVTPDGRVVTRFNRERKLRLTGSGGRTQYFVFNIIDERKVRVPVPVHRLAMYQAYGELIFEDGVSIRHLDGDSLNNSLDNLEIGSHSENMMDQEREVRVARAKHAASFQRKLTPERLASLREDRAKGWTYAQLGEKYGVPKSTLSRIFNGTLYCD